MLEKVDVVIIGASASGLMCGAQSGKRGRHTVILDHANKAGKKILISGGGRCNFTNYTISAESYISHNPHFCKSALSRYTQWDFIDLVQRYNIAYHERDHGQLFCDHSAKDILAMLLSECEQANVSVFLHTSIKRITKIDEYHFIINTSRGDYQCESLVIATGGLSFPKMGASPFGYKVAEQFGIKVWPPVAGLVPFTLTAADKDRFAKLSGIAVDSIVSSDRQSFRENVLFTHRGLSGPAILQISSYWQPGDTVRINLLPDIDVLHELQVAQTQNPKQKLKTVLGKWLPKRLVSTILDAEFIDIALQGMSHNQLNTVADQLQQWTIKPSGTEGYRTAEVTVGGVDCDALSSKTMECKEVPGLYFVGEVVDVTGWLGGYNFQWAWSSGWCAAQYV
ncbi:NAD(P)/FAD-dependent oxidoreductase [Kaarinaea lacus]